MLNKMITYFHPRKKLLILISVTMVFTRGAVEDTSLEATVKDAKKFRGQGQSLSRSRPRTKNTDASVLQKKEGFQKNFSSHLKKKVFKIFFSGNLYLRKPKKGLCRFSARFLAFSNEISTVQNSAVLEPRTGQFSRT